MKTIFAVSDDGGYEFSTYWSTLELAKIESRSPFYEYFKSGESVIYEVAVDDTHMWRSNIVRSYDRFGVLVEIHWDENDLTLVDDYGSFTVPLEVIAGEIEDLQGRFGRQPERRIG